MSINNFDVLNEVIYVCCRNVQGDQIDKYGKCFNEDQIKLIISKVRRNLRKDISIQRILTLVKHEIIWEESNLNRGTLQMIAEYGM